MKLSTSTKKTVFAMVLGLGLASAAGVSVNALSSDQSPDLSQQSGIDKAAAQVQSITDSSEEGDNVYEKYGGCGLSCAGCSVKCF